jgi:hypothetical protein
MDARAQSVRGILHSPVQYLIPFFQRHYSWRRKNWERLWSDLSTLIEDENSNSQHFMGPLVCTPAGSVPGEVPAFQLIDGQQRLTTLTLLLAAIRDVAREQGIDDLPDEVMEDYLIHKRKKGLQRFKVIPRLGDREVLTAVIEGKLEKQHQKQSVTHTWQFFRKKISDWATNNTADKLHNLFVAVTERLSLVVITIDEENPYEIFESLNSTGLPLEESDLIRNFIFMQVGIDEQDEFNTDHWAAFEAKFEEIGEFTAKQQTTFYRTYLMRDGVYSKAKFTFVDFKEQNRRRNLTPVEQVNEIKRFARYELMLRQPTSCEDEKLRKALVEIAMLDITTAHPLVMNLLDRFESGKITEESLLGCLQDLSSFVLRRSICGESTRSYGRWFCEAAAAIKDDPQGDLRKYWLRRGWPDDAALVGRLVEFPLFRREHKKCRLILERLEQSYGHKEKVEPSTLTIEHVMPQTIDQGKSAKVWKEMLGEAWKATHERWLHTLGNLTLSGYHLGWGNGPYTEKKPELAKSNLVLNRYFEKVATWGEEDIRTRGEKLSKEVALLWPRPAGAEYIPSTETESEQPSPAERRQQRLEYWTEFLLMAQQRDGLPKLPKASRRGWLAYPIGKSGFRLLTFVNFSKRHVGVALACRGPKGTEHFELLRNDRHEIEAALGEKLLWQPLVSGSSSHIATRLPDANPGNPQDWPRQHEWLVATLKRFHDVFSQRCKALGLDEAEIEGRHTRRQRFWKTLLERAAPRTSLHSGISPGRDGWIATGAGRSGLTFTYVIAKHAGRVELYIDRGKGRKTENKQIFDAFQQHQAEIEAVFGSALSWERLDARRGCRIAFTTGNGGYRNDEPDWPSIQDAMIDAMIRLETALAPRVADLKGDS